MATKRRRRRTHRKKTGHHTRRRHKVGAISVARPMQEVFEFMIGAGLGAIVGRIGMIIVPSIEDQIKDVGYMVVGGAAMAFSDNPIVTGAGCALVGMAVVDTAQNFNVLNGIEKVMAGLTGTTLVAGANGKNMLLTPFQRQQLVAAQSKARLNGGKVLAGRSPVSVVAGMKSGYMVQGG